jgi:hypothetical protein
MIGTIDTSLSSIRIGLIMIMGVFWFGLVIDTILRDPEEDDK